MENQEIIVNSNPETGKDRFDTVGLVGMILAIIGTVGGGIGFGFAGFILGLVAKKRITTGKKSPFAKAATVIGLVCTIVSVIVIIAMCIWNIFKTGVSLLGIVGIIVYILISTGVI